MFLGETANCELDFGSFRIFIKFQQRGDSSFGSAEVARKVIAVSPTLSLSRGVHLKLAHPISPMLIDSVTILLLSSQNRIFLPFLATPPRKATNASLTKKINSFSGKSFLPEHLRMRKSLEKRHNYIFYDAIREKNLFLP